MFVLSRQELGCICHRFVSLASFVSLLSAIRSYLLLMGKPRGCNNCVRAQKVELLTFFGKKCSLIFVGPRYYIIIGGKIASTRLLKVDGCHGVGRSRQKVGLHLSWGEVLPVLPPSPPEWMHFSQRHVCMPSCEHSFCIFHESGSCVVKGLYLSNIRFAFVIAMAGLYLLAEGCKIILGNEGIMPVEY